MFSENIHKILIIDDDIDYRKALHVRLKSLLPDAQVDEYDFKQHGSPPENFNWYGYDLLILDYDLGGDETGLDWFKRYKKSEHFPATLVLSGMEEKDIGNLVLKAGVHHYLSKRNLNKGLMYDGIQKAFAVKTTLAEKYKSHVKNKYDFDEFISNFLENTEQRLVQKIIDDAKRLNQRPDKKLINAEIELEKNKILKLTDYAPIKETKIGLLEIAADRVRNRAW